MTLSKRLSAALLIAGSLAVLSPSVAHAEGPLVYKIKARLGNTRDAFVSNHEAIATIKVVGDQRSLQTLLRQSGAKVSSRIARNPFLHVASVLKVTGAPDEVEKVVLEAQKLPGAAGEHGLTLVEHIEDYRARK